MSRIDRISSLPDCLLHQILSFLKTKESVQTSVLSKRWISIWKSVPRLNLDASDFNEAKNFKNFVSFVLYQKLFSVPEQLDTFSLMWHSCNEFDHHTIYIWIHTLISFKPRVVNINVSDINDMSFISHLFNCPSLESLFLWSKRCGVLPDLNTTVINLPCLRSLNLGWAKLGDEFIQRLILECPLLVELVLQNCSLDVNEKITSFTMKTLIMLHTGLFGNSKLRICMPKLEYLSCGFHLGTVSFESLESLEFACVNIWGMQNDYDGKKMKLLRGLSNAKTIELAGCCVNEMLEKESSDLPLFENLKTLVLCSFTIHTHLEPIDSLLTHAPNLEKLTLQHIKMEERRNSEQRGFREIQCDRLKDVEIVRPESYGLGVNNLVHSLVLHLKSVYKITIKEQDACSYFA